VFAGERLRATFLLDDRPWKKIECYMEGLYFYPDRKDEDYGKSNVENLEVHTLFQSEKEALSISDRLEILEVSETKLT